MRINPIKQDVFYLILLIIIVIGQPFGIRAYDLRLGPLESIVEAQEFTLTGHTGKGWVLGEVRAKNIISPGNISVVEKAGEASQFSILVSFAQFYPMFTTLKV